jgi:hypothetical protein
VAALVVVVAMLVVVELLVLVALVTHQALLHLKVTMEAHRLIHHLAVLAAAVVQGR